MKGYRVHNCHSCYYRHRCRKICWSDREFIKSLMKTYGGECRLWRMGQCYTCKHLDAPENEWFERGCEAYCFGGCGEYKRDWKKIWSILKEKLFHSC